ncbi:N-acetylglucosamine kinase [Ktedonobacter sp. SOSP1-52]|uniref:N-acetylglucosamine kinase n=1 Tax=Ktedonobacter sp. SOSP1-52 TaxID=2778366 RepID=UPI001914FF0B|nr:BadF/BadG/BcrA/BcrD ATPase family protein [Ktedonobacter sp. SOSP1-52]GHO67229.1 N-acetylglucosamine kinase [Ktedonobacter sp. SOSP1-52]
MQCVLAVDGGNTKTIALVASLDGIILGAGRSGSSNIYNAMSGQMKTSVEAAIDHIDDAVMAALEMAHISPSNLVSGVFNMAGANWPEDFTVLQAAMRERSYGRYLHVQNDALGVLHTGINNNIGVSVVCGTGTAIGSRGPDGRTWHSGYWQLDANGGYELSNNALCAVLRAELGLEQPSSLTERILEFFAMDSADEILHNLTSRDTFYTQKPYHASLTPILLNEAEAGDAVSVRLVREFGHTLGDYANVAARKVGIEGQPYSLVIAGGVLRHPTTHLSDAIIERVRQISPDIQPVRSCFEPVISVLFAALEAADVILDKAIIERLTASIPDSTLFETVGSTR